METFLDYQKYGPIVFGEEIPDADVSCVYINLKQSLREAFAYLKKKGVKNLGMTLGRSKNISHNSKVTLKIVREFFLDFDEENIIWDCFTYSNDGLPAANFFKKDMLMEYLRLVMRSQRLFCSCIPTLIVHWSLDERIY